MKFGEGSLAVYTASTLTTHFQDFLLGIQAKPQSITNPDVKYTQVSDIKVPTICTTKGFQIHYQLVEHSYSSLFENSLTSTTAQ